MILYFSATGNSRSAAWRLGRLLGEDTMSIFDVAPQQVEMTGTTLGFVFPIYSWGVPPIVTEYVRRLNRKFVEAAILHSVWIVATCGDDVAMAPEMMKAALNEAGLCLTGGWSLQMPNTYVLLPGFDVDSDELALHKLIASESRLADIAGRIYNKRWEESYVRGSWPRLKSAVVFPLFKKFGIFPSRWHADDSCVGCGRCAAACQIGNIAMKRVDGRRHPSWGANCISCLACYHVCPYHAVQYGKITRRKGQYLNGGNDEKIEM
ncbi:MAG: EFR1 family ferrodoxin [Muribaculaceae bacterium]|nr:EFR1 family ferrodoxin [Muribaculaceae bacterium]